MGYCVRTGIETLDEVLGELEEGSVTVLASQPAQGKTLLALAIARNVAASGTGVCYVSLEMSKEQLADRLVGMVAGVSQREYATESRRVSGQAEAHSDSEADGQDTKAWLLDATGRLRDARDLVGALPLYVEDGTVSNADGHSAHLPMGMLGIRATLADASRQSILVHNASVGLLIVDYAQLLVGPTPKTTDDRAEQVRQLASAIKHMAAGTGIRVLVLTQLNRKDDSVRPSLSHLRESGAFEQFADSVVAVYRPDAAPEKGETELMVLKHRRGSVGMARVSIDYRLGTVAPIRDAVEADGE